MAGYRPKSLDDINNSYDSEITVTRQIKRETTRLSQNAPSVDDVFGKQPEPKYEPEVNASESPAAVEDFSTQVEDFIKQISAKQNSVAKPQTNEKHEEPIIHSTQKRSEEPVSFDERTPRRNSENFTIPNPITKRSEDDFSDLMSDYVKIMNDMDEDPSEKKSFLSRKKTKKKSSQKQITESEENAVDENFIGLSDLPDVAEDEKEDSVEMFEELSDKKESDNSLESVIEDFQNAAEKEEPAQAQAEAFDNDDDFYGSFEELMAEDFEGESEKASNERPKQNKSKKSRKENKSNHKNEKQSEALKEESEGINNFDELIDYSQEVKATKKATAEKTKKAKVKKAPKKKKSASSIGRICARVVLSLVLVVSFAVTLLAGSLGMVFHVNEGLPAPGNLYFFTASRDFENTEVKAGDLVICNKKISADNGEVVIYIDPENRTFSFGPKDGGITGSDGEMYYVINDISVMRQNVLGVVAKTVPNMGKVITAVYSNYIAVLLGLLVLCIVLFLVVTIVLRDKEKDALPEKAKQKKNTAKK